MKLLYLPAAEVDVTTLEDTIVYLLDGFIPAPGQRL